MTSALLAAVLATLGHHDEARVAIEDLRAHAPAMTCTKYRENLFGIAPIMASFADALGEAGLPE